MLALTEIHHIAIIASDYRRSKAFYCDVLGFKLLAETYRAECNSWKGDLALKTWYVIELFSFSSPPPRPTQPETCGLRHLAFAVADIDEACDALQRAGVACEPLRVDEFTQRHFTFLRDPDGLPLELYEQ
ncbi:VOC family protein [BEV proteobacterium]|nr:VOC family protein [Candidatus Symbiopectobacterium sp. Chty_BC]